MSRTCTQTPTSPLCLPCEKERGGGVGGFGVQLLPVSDVTSETPSQLVPAVPPGAQGGSLQTSCKPPNQARTVSNLVNTSKIQSESCQRACAFDLPRSAPRRKRACAFDPCAALAASARARLTRARGGGFWACFGPARRGVALRAGGPSPPLKKHILSKTQKAPHDPRAAFWQQQ